MKDKYLTVAAIARKFKLSRRATLERLTNDKRFGELTTRDITKGGRIKAYLDDKVLHDIMTWPKGMPKTHIKEGNVYADIHLGGQGIPTLDLHISVDRDQLEKFVEFIKEFKDK